MAYKAVKTNRSSCVVAGTQYSLIYHRGTTVKKYPGTLGIFCFKTEKAARAFFGPYGLILKVRGKNPQEPPPEIPHFCQEDILRFYKTGTSEMIATPPGTILYDEVKVLE